MIATEVGGERYRLVFEHGSVPRGIRFTAATLERLTGGAWMTSQAGMAYCSSADPYVRETGRRIALRRLYAKACPPGQRAGASGESTNAKAMRRLMRAYFDRPMGRKRRERQERLAAFRREWRKAHGLSDRPRELDRL